jgi:hypothetical protein
MKSSFAVGIISSSLFILSCMILLILGTVKSGLATLVPGVADMFKAVISPAASFDLHTKRTQIC